jgi:hypothetical protein
MTGTRGGESYERCYTVGPRGLAYDGKRAESGDVVSDLPSESVASLLRRGLITDTTDTPVAEWPGQSTGGDE